MDPMTLSAGLSAVGSLFQGITGFFGGQRQDQAYQAAARQSLQEAGVNAQESLTAGDRTAAHGAVEAAASGGGLVGSSMGVIQDLSQQAMSNARTAIYGGQTKANQLAYSGQVAAANGQNQLISGVFGGASSLIGGWAKNAQMQQLNLALKGGPSYYTGSAADVSSGFGEGG